jgi:hypothetical protein
MKASTKRTYYPPRTFDDDLEALVKLFDQKAWAFSGVDLVKLGADATEQRTERLEHDALEGQYFAAHEKFGLAQEERYQRFAAALNAARGAFRSDKVAMAELNRFKRSFSRAKAKNSEAA